MRTSTSLIDFKTLTGDALPGNKGAYVELVASLPDTARFIKLMIQGTNVAALDTSMLIDLAVGAAASEVVKVPNVACGFLQAGGVSGSTRVPRTWGLPLTIPSGSRVAARIQSIITLDTALVAVDFYGGFTSILGNPAEDIDTMGANTAGTAVTGVQLTGNATVNLKGAWTEIEDSTPNAYRALAISLGGDSSMVGAASLIDIGMGASSSEVVVVPDIPVSQDSSGESLQAVDVGVFPLENEIAVGSRISARIASNDGAGSNADIRLIVHGIK